MRNEAGDDKVRYGTGVHRSGTMSKGAFRLALSVNRFWVWTPLNRGNGMHPGGQTLLGLT